MLVNRGLTVAKVHHSPSDFKQMENCPGFGKFWEIKKIAVKCPLTGHLTAINKKFVSGN